MPPSKAQIFGLRREIENGRACLTELGRAPNELLATTWLLRLGTATE